MVAGSRNLPPNFRGGDWIRDGVDPALQHMQHF